MARRIVRGSFWSVLGTGTGRVMNLVAMIIAARVLGSEGFGSLALVQSTVGLFGMFAGAALGATATRFIAATYRVDAARTGRIIGLVTGSAVLSAFLFGTIVVVLAPWLARNMLGEADLATATALGALLVGFGVLRGVQDATLAGFEAFRQIAVLRLIEGLAVLLLISPLVARLGVSGGIAALSLGLLVSLLIGHRLCSRELRRRQLKAVWRDAFSEWRLLLDFSAPSLMASTLATPMLWICILLLSWEPDGLSQIGVYNAAYQWHGPLVLVPTVIASVSLPILTQAWAEGDHRSFQYLFLKVLALGTCIAIVPAIFIAIMSPLLMGLYGDDFRSAELVLVLLVMAAPLHVAANISTSAIQSMNRSWNLLVFHGMWGATIVLVTVLTKGAWGAKGLSLAFLASYFVLATTKVTFVVAVIAKRNRCS